MKHAIKTLIAVSAVSTVIFCSGEIAKLITETYNQAIFYLASSMVEHNQILGL